jgi:hypothetical protein
VDSLPAEPLPALDPWRLTMPLPVPDEGVVECGELFCLVVVVVDGEAEGEAPGLPTPQAATPTERVATSIKPDTRVSLRRLRSFRRYSRIARSRILGPSQLGGVLIDPLYESQGCKDATPWRSGCVMSL